MNVFSSLLFSFEYIYGIFLILPFQFFMLATISAFLSYVVCTLYHSKCLLISKSIFKNLSIFSLELSWFHFFLFSLVNYLIYVNWGRGHYMKWNIHFFLKSQLFKNDLLDNPSFLTYLWCVYTHTHTHTHTAAAAAAKSLQLCPILCDPTDGSPPGSPVPGILQEHWSELPFPSPMHESAKWKWSRSVMSDS